MKTAVVIVVAFLCVCLIAFVGGAGSLFDFLFVEKYKVQGGDSCHHCWDGNLEQSGNELRCARCGASDTEPRKWEMSN